MPPGLQDQCSAAELCRLVASITRGFNLSHQKHCPRISEYVSKLLTNFSLQKFQAPQNITASS